MICGTGASSITERSPERLPALPSFNVIRPRGPSGTGGRHGPKLTPSKPIADLLGGPDDQWSLDKPSIGKGHRRQRTPITEFRRSEHLIRPLAGARIKRMIEAMAACKEWEAERPPPDLDWDLYEQSLYEQSLFEDSPQDWATQTAIYAVQELGLAAPASTSPAHIDRIAALERLRGVVAGLQATEEIAFADRQRAEQLAAGVKAKNLGRGIAEQIGFARGISPTAAAHHLGIAKVLSSRLPQAFALLRAGQVSEAQCQILATRTSHLSDSDAQIVDAAVAPRMGGWNKKDTEQAVDRAAYQIDPRAFVDRRGKAEADRRVWVRPAPDCMAIVSALVPASQGVAVYAALRAAAAAGRGLGDERRGLGQLMADTLVERVTGQDQAHLVPVTINLTISSDSLLNNGDEPGWLADFGPIPAELARAIAVGDPPPDIGCPCRPVVLDHPCVPSAPTRQGASPPDADLDTGGQVQRAKTWILRVLTEPITGVATDIDSKRRLFDGNARRFITVRDRECRQPFCSAPVRHVDHVVPVRDGGQTSIDNGQGVCERGNYVKEMPGWSTSKGTRPGEIITTTPTGHRYTTQPPAQNGLPRTTLRC